MKSLTLSLRKSGGRNIHGRISSFHIGGGHKQRYRIIDFTRTDRSPVIIRTIERDPNRSAYISLVSSETGILSFILTPNEIRLGDVIVSNNLKAVMTGASMKILNIPLGYIIYNISSKIGRVNNLVRSAGCGAQLLKKTKQHALLKLPSGKRYKLELENTATIGKLTNDQHFFKIYNKAGAIRHIGKTPIVRGVAMNPVDHPMGGKTHGKLHKTPWGKLAKGVKTRKK